MLLTLTHRAAHCVPRDRHHEPGSDTPALFSLQGRCCERDPVERSTVVGTEGSGGDGGMFAASTV